MSVHQKPKITPSIKNIATAPITYFDGVPTYGVMANVVELDLSASVIGIYPDSTTKREAVCVGHLRCSIEAALALRNALDGALKMAHALPPAAASEEDDDEPSPGAALTKRMSELRN